MTGRGLRLAFGAFVLAWLASCATKKDSATVSAAPPAAKAKSSPSPTATPAPTPEVRYTATARVEGGEPAPSEESSPSPTPSASPTPATTPTASPSPTATPAPANVFARTWAKIFPPKATPPPAVVPDNSRIDPAPAPTPIMVRNRPAEGFLTRTWHRIFPPKKEPPVAAPPQWIGTIKLVNEREGYALIDASNAPTLSSGVTLNSVGNESESGVLRMTADRSPPFFIADVVSGKPRAGDRIYSPEP